MFEIKELDVKRAVGRLGSEEVYLDTVKTYYDTVEKTAGDIERYWEEKNITNLTTKVHAIKSTSRIIGAMELGALAEALEEAGRREDETFLSENIQTLLTEYRRLGKDLEPLAAGDDSSDGKRAIDMDELNGIYDKLKTALQNSDYSVMEDLAEYLEESAVPEGEEDRVKEIVRAISDFDYDDVLSYVK